MQDDFQVSAKLTSKRYCDNEVGRIKRQKNCLEEYLLSNLICVNYALPYSSTACTSKYFRNYVEITGFMPSKLLEDRDSIWERGWEYVMGFMEAWRNRNRNKFHNTSCRK
jgi:hypothetical protein